MITLTLLLPMLLVFLTLAFIRFIERVKPRRPSLPLNLIYPLDVKRAKISAKDLTLPPRNGEIS